MLRDRYDIDKFFMEIQSLTSVMDPELSHIDVLLDDDEIFQLVKHDLAQRYPKTMQTGRPSTPVEVILRMLVVKRLYNWSYEATERHVSDSLVLRRFCRLYFEPVPDDTTLIRWAGEIAPVTLEALNARVTTIATALKVTRGRKLRTDGTVIETNIHHPTDSRLLADGMRVLSRTIKRAQGLLEGATDLTHVAFRDRTRSAKRAAQSVRQSSVAAQKTYRRLVSTARASLRQAQQVSQALKQITSRHAETLRTALETFTASSGRHWVPRTQQVIAHPVPLPGSRETERRVFGGEKVPVEEKLVSLFEPHTDILKTGKAKREVAFGHKVWLDEVDGGLIGGYRVLQGNPGDTDQWLPSLHGHLEQFGHPPWLASADRGVYSEANEAKAIELGVKRVILPKPGRKSDERYRHERRSWFRRGRRWHAGVEGRTPSRTQAV